MDHEQRINQFRNMAEADPENELGHFSLGKAYMDADRFAEAEASLRRTLELNDQHSKAFALLGRSLVEQDRKDEATELLTRGYTLAAERGDVLPRDEMATMLKGLGAAVPEVKAPVRERATASGQSGFRCSKCGRPHGKLERAPFKGALGEKIHSRICKDCWDEWIGMGTKVINELGLPLADPRAQAIYDEHMTEFLGLDD